METKPGDTLEAEAIAAEGDAAEAAREDAAIAAGEAACACHPDSGFNSHFPGCPRYMVQS